MALTFDRFNNDVVRTTDRWGESECAFWAKGDLQKAYVYEALARLNATVPTIFVYDIDHTGAVLVDKPGFYLRGRLEGQPQARRAELYLSFLNEVCKGNLSHATRIGVDVDDLCREWIEAPIFTFQKIDGTKNILLPDVDLLASDFYRVAEFWGVPEGVSYYDKDKKAIFVGSTTGVKVITKTDLEADVIPRVRAARYFRGAGNVVFLLTNIVQTLSEVERDILLQEGFGAGHVGWPEQLKNRFILSIDGNGAACSRVYVGLLSNSCLLKYKSNHVLYYFQGMKEWREFVPVLDDGDVIRLLSAEMTDESRFAFVAEAGRLFADKYLRRDVVKNYTLQLLERYSRLVR